MRARHDGPKISGQNGMFVLKLKGVSRSHDMQTNTSPRLANENSKVIYTNEFWCSFTVWTRVTTISCPHTLTQTFGAVNESMKWNTYKVQMHEDCDAGKG